MTDFEKKCAEISRLAALVCDGDATEAEMAELDCLLLDDPAAQDYYRAYMSLHVALEWSLADRAFEGAEAARLPTPAPTPIPGTHRTPPIGRQFAARYALAVAVVVLAAASAALVAWLGRGPGLATTSGEPEAFVSGHPKLAAGGNPEADASGSPGVSGSPSRRVARLARTADCRWADAAKAPRPGDELSAGRLLKLEEGVAEIEFDIGARVILQSPVVLELLSAKGARLEIGKATVEIKAAAARGFKIVTPEDTFVDQGTEFGVEVSPGGGSQVHVFQGAVDVDRRAAAGREPAPTQRLLENAGARMEAGEPGMTLVQDTGECFIRSIDEAGRDRHTIAYWRFEDRPVGKSLPHTSRSKKPVRATTDSTFNGNDLFTFYETAQPRISGDVPAGTVPQTGAANHGCLDNTFLPGQPEKHDLYTMSQFSHAAPLNIERIAPRQWTIEASVKAKHLGGEVQTFVGRDKYHPLTTEGEPPFVNLAFQIDATDRFAVRFIDAEHRVHEAVAERLELKADHWYNVAAVSDGRSLRLYVDAGGGRGYQLQAETALPATGSTALACGENAPEWSIGRGRSPIDNAPAEFFQGWIDEVRISDVARRPDELLFAIKPQDLKPKT